MSDEKMMMVDVVDNKTGKTVKSVGPKGARVATRLEDGMNINLDHERFHTVMREATVEEIAADAMR